MPEKVDNSLDDGKIKVGLHSSGFPSRLIAQFVCGVWVTAAASRLVDISSWSALSEADRYTSYSVAVGAGGILFPLIFLLMLHFCRQPFEKEIVYVKEEGLTLQKICAIFLVLWWGCGAGIGTFESPFVVPGNGYFALWAGFLFSLMGLGDVMHSAKQHVSTSSNSADGPCVAGPARGLFFAAVVLLIALIPWVDSGTYALYFDESLFGMIATAVTIVICLVLILITKLTTKVVQVIALLLCLIWAAVAGIMTFRAPFLTTGNGYFASYAGLFMAFHLSAVACLHKC